MATLGVISDTHSLLRPEAERALAGVDMILHAGDIGTPEVISRLQAIAPVIAIRGNVDKSAWAESIPETDVVEVAGKRIFLLHDIKALNLDPRAEAIDVVISGHSHKPLVREQDGVLYLNPGSAGPRRFKLPVAVARLQVSELGVEAEIHELDLTPASNT